MIAEKTIDQSCAEFFRALRESMGLSRIRMAERLNMSRKRWAAYEAGDAEPTLSEYAWICQRCGVDPLQPLLGFYAPEIYGADPASRVSELRRTAAHYIPNVATNAEVRSWFFRLFGAHGSDPAAQRAEEEMKNQLPLEHKLLVAVIIDALWSLDAERGELRCTDEIEPDVARFRQAIAEGRRAAAEGRTAYANGWRGNDELH